MEKKSVELQVHGIQERFVPFHIGLSTSHNQNASKTSGSGTAVRILKHLQAFLQRLLHVCFSASSLQFLQFPISFFKGSECEDRMRLIGYYYSRV